MSVSRRRLLTLAAPAVMSAGIAPAVLAKSKKDAPANASISTKASYAANLLADGKSVSIECYGDSTMWGSIPGNTTTNDKTNPSASLQQALGLIYPGQVYVKNCAIPGTTIKKLLTGTDGGTGTYEERISKSKALVIFCNHCLNDCNSYQSDESEYRQNLLRFINITRKYKKIPILVTPSIISPIDDGKEFMMKRMPAFIETMRNIASEMNVDLVDNYYYSFKTSRMIPASKINGDGVHLNPDAYQNAGWNMAIPLVLANTLYNQHDLCGLSTSTYNDNIKLSRAIWRVESRFGSVLTGDSIEDIQHIYFPVVLENPTDYTTLVIGGFHGESGGEADITYFGAKGDSRYSGRIDYKKDTGIFYDQIFTPKTCKLSAGFHIIGIESSLNNGGKNFNFAGVQLLPAMEKNQ